MFVEGGARLVLVRARGVVMLGEGWEEGLVLVGPHASHVVIVDPKLV